MKKVLISILLLAIITASVVTGTFALYSSNVKIEGVLELSAKEFIFVADSENDSYSSGIKIAPTETVKLNFSYKNFSDTAVSGVQMRIETKVIISNETGYDPIEPLKYQVVRLNGESSDVVSYGYVPTEQDADGNRTLTFYDFFKEADKRETKNYQVIINWQETENDIDYINCKNHITINATSTQDSTTVEVIGKAETVNDNSKDFYDKYLGLTQKDREELLNCKYTSNDLFRTYLKNEVYGGEWPTIPHYEDPTKKLFVQPYFYVVGGEVKSMCSFVSRGENTDVNWNALMIFDHEEEVWYRNISRLNYTVINSWENIKAEIHSSRWVPVFY